MKIEGSFPARTSIAMSSNFRNSIPAEVGAIYDEYSSLFAKLTHKQGNSDIFDDPLFDPYWLYQALDKAIQVGKCTVYYRTVSFMRKK